MDRLTLTESERIEALEEEVRKLARYQQFLFKHKGIVDERIYVDKRGSIRHSKKQKRVLEKAIETATENDTRLDRIEKQTSQLFDRIGFLEELKKKNLKKESEG